MRILIVDNDTKFAESLARTLERQGFTADCLLAQMATEEKMLLFQHAYDLIIFDRAYPDMSRKQIRKKVRARKVKIPLLLLTSDTDETASDEVDASESALKPASPDELLPLVEELLARPVEVVYEDTDVGGVILNEAAQQAYIGKKTVRLTQTEFAILHYLVTHAGTVVTRDQILSHVWGLETDASSNVVDTHVKNLRKKLNGEKKIIETIRSIGYRIRE